MQKYGLLSPLYSHDGQSSSAMARSKISIDDRVEQQKQVVSKAKDRYEAELEQLNQLMKKRDELRNKELLQAIEHSNRSFEEIMEFFSIDDSQE